MVFQVQGAFNSLSKSGQDVLEFMAEDVKPSYEMLMDTGIKYEKDAEFMHNLIEKFSASSKQIDEVVIQVRDSIENIFKIAKTSEINTQEISRNVNEITKAIGGVAKSSVSQSELSNELNKIVRKFKI